MIGITYLFYSELCIENCDKAMSIYLENRQIFADLGKRMRNYALSVVIFAGISLLLVAILISLAFNLHFGRIWGFGIGMLVSMIILGIGVFVFYIQFIIGLGKTAHATNQPDLQRSYKCYMWAIITTIIGVVLIIILVFSLMFMMMIQYSPSENQLYGDMYQAMAPLIGLVIVIVIVALVPVILQIMAAMSLYAWGDVYASQLPASYHARTIKHGGDLIKWGAILSIIPYVGFISSILEIVGFYQMGNGLMKEFSGNLPSISPTAYVTTTDLPAQPTQIVKELPISPNAPSGAKFCMYCGVSFPVSDPHFCPQCGRPQK